MELSLITRKTHTRDFSREYGVITYSQYIEKSVYSGSFSLPHTTRIAGKP